MAEMSAPNETLGLPGPEWGTVYGNINLNCDPCSEDIRNIYFNNTKNVTQCPSLSHEDVKLFPPIMMTVCGVLGNAIALLVLYRSKLRHNANRSVFFTLVHTLVLTDLIGQGLVTVIPLVVYGRALKWFGGCSLCQFHGFMMICFGFITPLIVCIMALERVMALYFTFFYQRHFTIFRIKLAIGGAWLFVLGFSTFPFLGFGRYVLQFPNSWCFLQFHFPDYVTYPGRSADMAYTLLYATINLIVILTTIVCNSFVIALLCKMRQSRKKMNVPSQQRRMRINSARGGNVRELEIQMIWFLCGMTLVFTCCWTPFMIRIIYSITMKPENLKPDLPSIRAAAFNQILDPWVYILLRKSIIDKLLNLVSKLFCCPGALFQSVAGRLKRASYRNPNIHQHHHTQNRQRKEHMLLKLEQNGVERPLSQRILNNNDVAEEDTSPDDNYGGPASAAASCDEGSKFIVEGPPLICFDEDTTSSVFYKNPTKSHRPISHQTSLAQSIKGSFKSFRSLPGFFKSTPNEHSLSLSRSEECPESEL